MPATAQTTLPPPYDFPSQFLKVVHKMSGINPNLTSSSIISCANQLPSVSYPAPIKKTLSLRAPRDSSVFISEILLYLMTKRTVSGSAKRIRPQGESSGTFF